MNQQATVSQMSHAEQEAQTEAKRLTAQVEAALAAVSLRSADEADEIELAADKIERAARDLAVALRGLAHERKNSADER